MAEEVIGSFPFEEWAQEIQNALLGKGIQAEVSYAGLRAYPVVINESDSEKAGEILSEIGYLTCAVGSGLGLSGVLDWHPAWEGEGLSEEEMEELRDELDKALESMIDTMADMQAAMSWSATIDDDEWIQAEFGDSIGVNGELVDESKSPPRGYESTDKGGRIPCAEEHVSMEHAIRAVEMKFSKRPRELISHILNDIWQREYKGQQETPVSVSGDAESYVRKKKKYGK